MGVLSGKRVLLVISGGIAAYKSLELIRFIRKAGGHVRCVLTKGGEQFITPLSVSALSEEQTYTDLWSLKDETDLSCEALAKQEMGHIRLGRETDLVVVAPATANIIAKMAHGLADDLASTILLATDKPVMLAPAMNPVMWSNPATQDNVQLLQERGISMIGPEAGDMACGETGIGRMAEPEDIFAAIVKNIPSPNPLPEGRGQRSFALGEGQSVSEVGEGLKGYKALVTSGPTHEPIDPVRFIGNRSSGKQGHAIARALCEAGADVTLISGPVALADPEGVKTVHVGTAQEMLEACMNALPADIVVCAAAVGDWRVGKTVSKKIKKRRDQSVPTLKLVENSDILATLAKKSSNRPALVIGFAAETEDLIETATKKRVAKSCDWIVANDVSEKENIFGGDENHVYLITESGNEEWERTTKYEIARKLVSRITSHFENCNDMCTEIAAE